MPDDHIRVRGAREHNLKNIDIDIPRDRLVVITGLSGSGKSSLAFDTIYAEGQRRYVESLSAYARQFLGQMEKPDVDSIEGLSPAISIDQKGVSHNPRSTVGTVTEVYDYMRLLYARLGVPHCPKCGREISRQTVQQIVDAVNNLPNGSRILVMSPLIQDRKGEHERVFDDARKNGFVRVRVDGQVRDLSEDFSLDKKKKHTVEVVVDRLVVRHGTSSGGDIDNRMTDSIETALKLGGGVVLIGVVDGPELMFSEHFACVYCGISLSEIEPRTFSFNSPHGACAACSGLGTALEIDPDLVLPDRTLTLGNGAVEPYHRPNNSNSYYMRILESLARHYGFGMTTPVQDLSERQINLILYGTKNDKITVEHDTRSGSKRTMETPFEGVISNLERRYKETDSDWVRSEIERYMTSRPCPSCKGARLKPESLAVTIQGKSVIDVTRLSIGEGLSWFRHLQTTFTDRQMIIGTPILKEIDSRLGFLLDVGLEYLTMNRQSSSLSGGESQRIRLATQIGSSLMGVLYILDEPSIGLHQRDNRRLIDTLIHLRELGNTVIVVEHDEETIRQADFVIDIGPGAGEHGGYVVAAGPLDAILKSRDSVTGQFLRGEREIPIPTARRTGNGRSIIVRGARANNLKNVSVEFPLQKLVCVTGVSGSGKSTLVEDILFRKLAQVLYRAKARPLEHDSIEGLEEIDKVIDVDQSPIGRTPRSNPATYTGMFTPIRELFSSMPEARIRGYLPGRFSFNVKGGRCEACQGAGIVQIEMQFLPDVYVQCEVCSGKRYNREALEIRYKGKTISEVLEMTVDEAAVFFENVPTVRNKLVTITDVGLGYIRLGQPATQLSGGEAQRIKLATELSKRSTGRTMYILDEPTTGLHFADVERLLAVLQRLTDSGNTVLVIEHNLDIIKASDWLIDMGPEGGNAGGEVLVVGTPEDVAAREDSYTGQYLRRLLDERRIRTLATVA